ncbi:MAG: FHA domain-containing protein [Pyrinomonadaceae bacterium]|nr:FHA domain-containing protein [Pyrinomonadaceae bacterium]
MTIKLVVKNGKQTSSVASETLTLEDLLITLGNSQGATVRLNDAKIAPEQAVIVNEKGSPLFINQAKGTVLNGKELGQGVRHELESGDELQIGVYNLTVHLDDEINFDTVLIEPDELKNSENSANANTTEEPAMETTKLDVRSFADILTSLRKEEDQFYFQINGEQNNRRLPIENDETLIGWNLQTKSFTSNTSATVDKLQAIVRKDWSGITVYPQGDEAILLNDALLEAGERLKNGDKLVFVWRVSNNETLLATLTFCEPAALVELNSILPQKLLSDALETNQSGEITIPPEAEQSQRVEADVIPKTVPTVQPKVKKAARRNLLYFSIIEIFIMIIATILTAGLTFLLLEIS